MRNAIIAAAAVCLVVVVGCSSEGTTGNGSNGSAGVAGSNGAAGAAGSTGPQGPEGPAGPKGDKGDPGSAGASATSSKNGTRIKVAKTTETTADGMEVVTVGGYVDTARANEPCTPAMAGDGQLRCLPTAQSTTIYGTVMWLNNCMTGVGLVSSATPTGATKYAIGVESVPGRDGLYRVFDATTTATGVTQVCRNVSPTDCTCRGVQAGEVVYRPEVPATDFAAITRTHSTL